MTKDYLDYIHSPRWRAVKQRFLSSKLRQDCYVCHRWDVPLDLHHKTYKRLFHEKLTDLMLLCRECHKLVHEYNRRYKKHGLVDAARKLTQLLKLRKRSIRHSPDYPIFAENKIRNLKSLWSLI